MSKIEKIKLKEIHYNPYKEYLKSNKNILKWFSWNLTNTTKNHSYFFISSFMEEHISFHAEALYR